MTTVVDASVVVDWVAPDLAPAAPALVLLDRLAAAGEPLAAPELLILEVGNALLTGIRRGRWNGAEADAAYAHLRSLPIMLYAVAADVDRAFELSRRYDEHPAYDMVYVALAERLSTSLVTADTRLLERLRHVPYVVGVAG
ncbi:MAG: type II toxin-antitoxin system VapC family toxin [Frankiaceae bacterium]|nr:type II toxin-antitoxin system VapC family toxin [Frankiaceae bacterium]